MSITLKLPTLATPAQTHQASVSARQRPEQAFGAVLASQKQVVVKGDTLTGMVKAQARAQGVQLDEASAYRAALQVARDNQLADADHIVPGQRIHMDAASRLMARQASQQNPMGDGVLGVNAARRPAAVPTKGATIYAQLASAQVGALPLGRAHDTPVLERTLERAVSRGYMSQSELPAVRGQILSMSQRYGFHPDDFAVVSLMESDGLNPQATNGSCHGVIQFCEGPNRGAASVGLGGQAESLLRMSAQQQLELTERYLADVGMAPGQAVGLDDLYLAVLTPAARAVQGLDAPLPVAGRQASALYVNQDPRLGITRRSLIQGLVNHASSVLGITPEALVAQRREGTETLTAAATDPRL